jgi:hypothetical protein
MPERQRRSALGELETFDLGRVELAAVWRIEHGELVVDEAVECDAAIADIRDRVDLETGGIAERRVVHPAARHRRIHLAEPDEVDVEGVIVADVDLTMNGWVKKQVHISWFIAWASFVLVQHYS